MTKPTAIWAFSALVLLLLLPEAACAQSEPLSELKHRADSALQHIGRLTPDQQKRKLRQLPNEIDSLRERSQQLNEAVMGRVSGLQMQRLLQTNEEYKSLSRANVVAEQAYLVALVESKRLSELHGSGERRSLPEEDAAVVRQKLKTNQKADSVARKAEKIEMMEMSDEQYQLRQRVKEKLRIQAELMRRLLDEPKDAL